MSQMRIGFAQRLLRKGRALAPVAEEVGYGCQPAFSRAFIRETGIDRRSDLSSVERLLPCGLPTLTPYAA